ncbi:hypothetical protein GCM10009775_14920 [Microbacterium aoyamense]|uniref:YtxH domain-containing protein n=1 Tax=Microbacterium aoyamense TaxID=344166 RepID=A0ABN2PJQ7_9MICO|nr:hypothetical protein [Microbacterium aoyamense]
MRGKAGLVVGLAVGYVLGTRAGRERYEQIKTQWLKVWNTAPVQNQVDKVKDFTTSAVLALPTTLWNTAVKVGKAATSNGTPGQRLDASIKVGKDSADDIAGAAKKNAEAVKDAAQDALDDVAGTQGRGGA